MIQTTLIPLNRAVTLHHTATEGFKTARLSLYTVLPAHKDNSPLTTLLFGILRRGSEHYPRLSLLNRRLDELYGTTLTIRNYLHGDAHVVCYTAEMLEEAFLPPTDADMDLLGGVMELLADMLLHPLKDGEGFLRAETVEKEKRSLLDSLLSRKNDTRTWAANRLREIMCEGEPYGLSVGGSPEQVTAMTPAAVTTHYEAMLACTHMELFYTGRASAETVEQAWGRAFGAWTPAGSELPPCVRHEPPDQPRVVQEDLAVSQGKLCMGWACGENYTTLQGDPQTLAAFAVCNELLGVMQNSLLFRHVREELGLCYYCESALDMTKGILWVSCGIHPHHRAAAEAAIHSRLARLQEGAVEDEDLAMAKLSLLNSYQQIEDSQSSLEIYAFHRLMNQTAEAPEEEMACIQRVTVADIARVARSFRLDTVFFLNGTATDTEEGEYEYED